MFVKPGTLKIQLNARKFLPDLYLIQLTFEKGCTKIMKMPVQ